MANPEHLKILAQGVSVWNNWPSTDNTVPDLSDAYFVGFQLGGINLEHARLHSVMFNATKLKDARFGGARIIGASFAGANLANADFSYAQLDFVSFLTAYLVLVNFLRSELGFTSFANTNLQDATNLETCLHLAPHVLTSTL